MIRIVIADDHEIVRKGLIQIVSNDPEMTICGEASDARELLQLLRKEDCDVVVLDIKMPGRSGLEVLGDLQSRYPNLPVLILSTYAEDDYAIRILQAGGKGFLSKQTAPQELIAAIRTVYSGKQFVSVTLAEKLALMVGKEADKSPHEKLSAREFMVMRMIAEGMALKEIAYNLKLSEKTVSTYRTRILEKMNMSKNVELARYAIKHGLID
jgi:two-component system, NarL family, invasion response regulator UvrY